MERPEAVADRESVARERIVSFGKYLLLSRVSIGGMAEVFKAIPEGATRIEQIVAIKRILPNIAEDREFIGMFIDEARLVGQLDHPNICRIYELGKVGAAHYIAMQFLWGRDLLKVMNRFRQSSTPMPAAMASVIAERASAALHYAHTKHDAEGQPLNIIHRDVSPQNIIVGYGGQVKLIDFGVARAASQNQKTQVGILKGKFGYMSPEMIRGLPVDHRSDVFAMGVCLYEALTGTRLFLGESDFQTLEQVRAAKVEPPSRRAPGIDAELDAIVLKALARESEDRFGSAAELEEALREHRTRTNPEFGENDVGTWMQKAFAPEIARERCRLEDITRMLHEERLVRGGELTSLPSDTHALSARDLEEEGGIGGQTTKPVANPLSLVEELEGHKTTQIFFSAEELDEIYELESEPQAIFEPPPAEPWIAGEPASPMPSYAAPRAAAASGTFTKADRQRDVDYSGELSLPPRGDETLITTAAAPDAFSEAPPEPPRRLLLGLGLLFAALGALLFLYVHSQTGSIDVLAMGTHGAIVRVDGVVRGNPPLSVEGLAPGVHRLEIEASGYAPASQIVRVRGGRATPVGVVLERLAARGAAPIKPVVEARTELPPPVAPVAEQSPAPAAAAPAPRPRARESHRDVLLTRGPARLDKALTALAKVPSNTGSEPLAMDALSREEAEPTAEQAVTPPEPELVADDKGELLISTLPWSRVFIDDEDTGRDTPVRALRVSPGPHRVGLRTPDGFMHVVDVYVETGQVVRIIRRF